VRIVVLSCRREMAAEDSSSKKPAEPNASPNSPLKREIAIQTATDTVVDMYGAAIKELANR